MSKKKVAKLIDRLTEAHECRINAIENGRIGRADFWSRESGKIRAKLRKKGYPVEE